MVGMFRPRRLASFALLGVMALGLAACAREYPNSTFNETTEYNTAIKSLWDKLLWLGTAVFVLVEAGLIYTIIRFRRRPGSGTPEQVHGNTALEITWTAIPAVILVFVAIPTVQTIFKTQAKAAPDALVVDVIGHQWWWEFKYPQYGITTANELYIPTGRTVAFNLKTIDVLHSFWIPQLGGKRDLISNKTNYMWFTPRSDLPATAYNGFCAEFCGTSHGNMDFRVFAVTPDDFAKWTAHQKSTAAYTDTPAPAAVPTGAVPPVPSGAGSPVTLVPASLPALPPQEATQKTQPQARQDLSNQAAPGAPLPAPAPVAEVWAFPKEKIGDHIIPKTPLPKNIAFDDNLLANANAQRGMQTFTANCIGCHAIAGNKFAVGNIGPNLTHIGTRYTIAGAIYPNDARHLARWIKNAPVMKPGSIMQTFGAGLTDPIRGLKGNLSDAQIADLVAYLQALK